MAKVWAHPEDLHLYQVGSGVQDLGSRVQGLGFRSWGRGSVLRCLGGPSGLAIEGARRWQMRGLALVLGVCLSDLQLCRTCSCVGPNLCQPCS